uniref:Uncharacterized protein n=1 Tax=Zea mays TaxID=4577 RepID=C4J0I6_MAIZE|nr:unknown [Zea mays]
MQSREMLPITISDSVPYLLPLGSISDEVPSSAAPCLCRNVLFSPCTGCCSTEQSRVPAHVWSHVAPPTGAWLSASEEEDVTQLSAERRRVGEQQQEEDRDPVSTAEASSASAPAAEPRPWSARTSCARRSTDCRYLPCASILSCRCRCTSICSCSFLCIRATLLEESPCGSATVPSSHSSAGWFSEDEDERSSVPSPLSPSGEATPRLTATSRYFCSGSVVRVHRMHTVDGSGRRRQGRVERAIVINQPREK